MMRNATLAGLVMAAALVGTALPALAEPDCTSEPRETWMAEEAFKAKMTADQGLTSIDKFKVTDGNCYEIYGRRGDTKLEIYANPVTAAIVELETED